MTSLKYYFFIAFSIISFVSVAQTTITWTGNSNSDWHNACNWNPPQVPTCLDDVIVPYIAPPKYQPLITAIAGCKTIDIKSDDGAVVTINSGGILQLTDVAGTCPTAITVNANVSGTITIAAGAGGTVSPLTTILTYAGSAVTITATPSTGYHFVSWAVSVNPSYVSIANSGSAATTISATCSMPQSGTAAVTATFAANILILRPNAAGGWTDIPNELPNSGYHFDKVNLVTPNDATTYIYSNTSDAIYYADMYNLPNHTSESGIINSVSITWRGNASSSNRFKPRIMPSTNPLYGTEVQSGNGTFQNFTQVWTTNPETGIAWTWATIDALQVGISIYTTVATTTKCSQLYATVNYTP
jgi:hypothetical protein